MDPRLADWLRRPLAFDDVFVSESSPCVRAVLRFGLLSPDEAERDEEDELEGEEAFGFFIGLA